MEEKYPLEVGCKYMVMMKDSITGDVKQRPDMVFVRAIDSFITFFNEKRQVEETYPYDYMVRIEKQKGD